MEALGLCRVAVEDGSVISVTKPLMNFCPMFAKMRGMEHLDSESVRRNIEFRIRDFGLFTENRQVRGNDIITFGVSEILSYAIRQKKLDAACVVSDGCGSVIISDPEILQGLCGRISGIIETSPLKVVQDAVGTENILDPVRCTIDPVAIARKASERGYGRIAVTVARSADARSAREILGDRGVIVGVHTSGMSRCDVDELFEYCDVTTACASGFIREKAFALKAEGMVEIAGNKVQIVAISDLGKELVGDKLRSLGRDFWNGTPEAENPTPFIDGERFSRSREPDASRI